MAAITNLYLELDLKSVFAEHQRSRHNEAKALIDKYRGAVPKELFFKFLKDMDDFRYVWIEIGKDQMCSIRTIK